MHTMCITMHTMHITMHITMYTMCITMYTMCITMYTMCISGRHAALLLVARVAGEVCYDAQRARSSDQPKPAPCALHRAP